jgi:hypothetical protein
MSTIKKRERIRRKFGRAVTPGKEKKMNQGEYFGVFN